MFTDTHTHLYDKSLLAEETQMIQRALDAGVTKMYMPNCNSETIDGMMHLARTYPQHCFPMMGLHPCYVKEDYKSELQKVQEWLDKDRFYAVGEIGLDYYWDLSFKQQQIEAFEMQIDLALQHRLPIVIHSRESTRDCMDIIRRKGHKDLKGVFHCFSGSIEEAKEITAMGFYLGIGGVVTYKKTNLPEVLAEVGLAQIVLETDAPYLAPVPYRGKRNESRYIPVIAKKIAEVLGIDSEEVSRSTTENAERLFG